MQDLLKKLSRNISKKAAIETFSKIAKVTAVKTGGYYNVEISSGVPVTDVVSIAGSTKFYVGQWVTLEQFGGDWSIVGIAATKGGD